MEKRVFDLVARRFIAVFYPDCKFATTTVIGEADSIEFKATGKQILDPGWRVIFAKPQTNLPEGMTDPDAEARESDEEHLLTRFCERRKRATSAQTRREVDTAPTAIYRSNFTARYGNCR